MTDLHHHQWRLSPLVIDTIPEKQTWYCECGAATHNPHVDGECGDECRMKHYGLPREAK